jgi:hypothetical protein
MKRLAVLLVAWIALAACGSLPQPFSKDGPLPPQDGLVAPPWEAMVKAGPGAVNDLDLETLHGPQQATVANGSAGEKTSSDQPAAPKETAAAKRAASVTIKAVVVGPVTGDSAEGNRQLAEAMRETLQKAGWPVRAKKGADTLVITGKVRIGEPRGAVQTVSLAWDVLDPSGNSLGLVSQTNDIPAGSLADGWGDNATAAVEAAATGVFALIDKLR